MSSRPLRILVVDDDPAMVGAITALVGTEGHQVITAYDGLTAVRRFRDEHPDLVLLDLAMPGPDGFNVAGQMRAIGQAPILVVSGESGEAAKVRALVDGRYAVSVEDVRRVALPVLRHRVLIYFHGQSDRITDADVVGAALEAVRAPLEVAS